MSVTLRVDISPAPASRPRVGKFGAFYSGSYQTFRKELDAFKNEHADDEFFQVKFEKDVPIVADIVIVCEKPKSGKKEWPKGDVDNYAKAILDGFNGVLYHDDDQIVRMTVEKGYAEFGEEPYFELTLTSL